MYHYLIFLFGYWTLAIQIIWRSRNKKETTNHILIRIRFLIRQYDRLIRNPVWLNSSRFHVLLTISLFHFTIYRYYCICTFCSRKYIHKNITLKSILFFYHFWSLVDSGELLENIIISSNHKLLPNDSYQLDSRSVSGIDLNNIYSDII